MTIRFYSSTDTGSPGNINNVAGQLIGALDVLVNGYALGTVSSITRTGSTATLTFSAAHGLLSKGNRITIAGAEQTEYNGEFLVVVPDTTTVTFTVTGTPATPATGTITAAKAGAGWTKPYTGTNLAAYKQGTGSNGFYLYVDDTGTTTARAVGYETMTSISDTTGSAFPTSAQVSGGLHLHKSGAATTRAWRIFADEKYVYFWVDYSGSVTGAAMWFFGDFPSRKVDDAFNTAFISSTGTSLASNEGLAVNGSSITSVNGGHFIARASTQTGTSITVSKIVNYAFTGGSQIGTTGTTYPAIDGNLLYSEGYLGEVVLNVIRGSLPGYLAPLHVRPLASFDTFTGSGTYAGKTYVALPLSNNAQIFIQVE